ncbi:TLDc domain-containing protein [Entamoeba marina]
MNILKEWSTKTKINVIFDSDIDGDASNNVLHDIVLNKNNLYFIHFDSVGNIFGGYVSSKIDKSCDGDETGYDSVPYCIYDENAFIFLLMNNGKKDKQRYFIKQGCEDEAFLLWFDDLDGALYTFGWDLFVSKIGSVKSLFFGGSNLKYNYNNDVNPFTGIVNTETFEVYRIMVIQMN